MIKQLSVEQKLELIKRNTQEIIGEDELKKLLESKKKPIAYWGTAPTGRPHIGYFFPALKIASLLKVGFKVKVLIADLHASLDNVPWYILEKRYDYYAKIIPLLIQSIGLDTKDLEFVLLNFEKLNLKVDKITDIVQLTRLLELYEDLSKLQNM